MCGIAGYIGKNKEYLPDKEILKSMTDTLIHRGPDAEGQWCDSYVGFGHRRLAIIDIDAKSNQPMFSYDKQYVIVFNGEIYNYLELRKELEEKGAVFQTNSDTEVIIEAYRFYNTKCFNKFNGMWAFALYDIKNKKVVFCRDRFGIKPLYIAESDNYFAFASEMKAIIEVFPEENVVNERCIYRYLTSSVNEDTDEETFFKNIKIFPPAAYMEYSLDTNQYTTNYYWKVDEKNFHSKWIKGKNPIKTFKKLFDNSVELRLRADVEVGACLSGGLDSSAIVGCTTKKFGKRMHTFSSIYNDKECNEEFYIEKVNKKWNAIAHKIRPDDYEGDFTKYIDDLTYHHDQPTNGASLYSQYNVMKGIKGNVKVVLDGQGADELFAGYIPYYSYYIADLIKQQSFTSKLKAIKVLAIVMKEWPEIIGEISTDKIVSLVGIKNSFMFQNDQKIKELKTQRNVQLFTEDFMTRVEHKPVKEEIICSSELNTRLCNDVIKKSVPSLLHNEDGNSMAFSIETRVPFLDYRIVEFAIALNGKYKIKNAWTKWIIRKACNEYLPKEVVKRKNKMGFPAPFSRWLREGKSKEEIRDVIYAFGKRNIVPKESIEQLYVAHINNEADNNVILFKFYSMELWFRRFEKKELVE